MHNPPFVELKNREPLDVAAVGAKSLGQGASVWTDLTVTSGLFAAMILLMRPLSFGDSIFYVQSILEYGHHQTGLGSLFEFGHLLWRPIGWVLFDIIRTLFPTVAADGILVLKILICISVISGAIATAILHLICRDRGFGRTVSFLVCAVFVFSNAVIYAAQTGSSYMLALAFLMAALWLAMRDASGGRKRRYVGLWCAGLLLAFSAASWFPFILVAPAVCLAAAIRWDEPEPFSIRRLSLVRAANLAGAGVAGTVILFGAAATLLHINSVTGIRSWMSGSTHGWRQSSNLLRVWMGLPRCCMALKDDAGIVWKRFLFHDPFAPVRPQDLLQSSLLLMAVFYFGMFLLLYTLARSKEGKAFLILLTVAAVPVLYFSIVLFEPSSIERFMPVFPFYFVALGYQFGLVWSNPKQRNLALLYPAVLIFFAFAVYNNTNVARRWLPAQMRLAALKQQLPPQSTVALLVNWDDLFLIAKDDPLHDSFSKSLNLWVVLQPANERIFTWREKFASRVLEAWKAQNEMWVSERLLEEAPLPEWGWVEGDDAAIRWSQVPEFCRQFQYDKKIGDSDGFVRLAPTQTNHTLLDDVVAHHREHVATRSDNRASTTIPF
jgi:hypothetical protein